MSQRGKKPSMPQFPGDFIPLGAKSGSAVGAKRDVGQVAGPTALGKPKSKVMRPSPPSSVVAVSAVNIDTQWENLAVECDPTELTRYVEEAEATDTSEGYLLGAIKQLKNQRAKPDPVLYLSLMHLSKSKDYLFMTKDIIDAFCSLLKRDVKEAYKSKGNALVSVLAANLLMSALRHERQWPDLLVKVYIEDAVGERVWVDHPDCKGFVENICTAFETKMPQFFGAGGSGTTGGGAGSKTPVTEGAGTGRESPGLQGGGSRSGSGSATPTRPGTDEDSQGMMMVTSESLPINVVNLGTSEGLSASTSPNPTAAASSVDSVQIQPRFESVRDTIEQIVIEVVRDQFNRRQGGSDNITRSFIKFLTSVCGLLEVRHMVLAKLEMWIMNPKISRAAQELLMAVAMNCNTHSHQDVEVIGGFTKFRFKNKPNINLYLSSIRELCSAHKENMPTLLKHTVFNELSNARNTNNMSILQVMFNHDKELAPASLAAVFIELLMLKECYLRALRALLREIVRFLRYDINLHTFCVHLMQLPPSKELMARDFEFRERMFTSITDLITLAIFLGISPSVKEGMSAYIRGDDKKDISPFKLFLKQTALIQRDTMVWMLESALKIYKPDNTTFPQSLHKVLFMVPSEEYWRVDGWPDEASRHVYIKATSEIPLCQDTICHLFVIGISKQHPINGRDVIDLVEHLVKRAAGLHPLISEDFQVLSVDRVAQVMEILFQLAAYNYPDSITLPKDYQPPKMAISTAYWKAWLILVLLCAHNPSDFGAMAWKNYPSLRAMMEMCITNQFIFPPPKLASGKDQAEEMRAKEVQTSTMEKQDILQFEIHLAAATNKATITESNSLLLAQLITNNPEGELRRPPQAVLDQLAQANQHYKIGHLLCRSRDPDFLLDILQRQGSNQAMPWLADLVESSEGSFNVLPVQCLCEFLLNSTNTTSATSAAAAATSSSSSSLTANLDNHPDNNSAGAAVTDEHVVKQKKRKQKHLLLHLQNLLQQPLNDEQQRSASEILDYFMRRLSSQETHQRQQALKGLQLVLSPIEPEEEDEEIRVVSDNSTKDEFLNSEWLLKRLPRLPCFATYYPQISNALRCACQYENDPLVVSMYIQFLAHYAPDSVSDLSDLCLEISSIIVERSTLLPAILPGPTLCKTPPKVANDTYAALLRLFLHFMSRVRQQGQAPTAAMAEWMDNETQELIMVHWQLNDVTAIIHFFIVHAQIILLTYGVPVRNNEHGSGDLEAIADLFNQLLHIWSPYNGKMPRAFMIDASKKEVVLIPDWLKLKMIRSEVAALVDAALVELGPQQLVLFIQSFGIPVASMSKLLQKLDRAVQSDFEGVINAVHDRAYMGQLISVQHQRGAIYGEAFAEMLNLNLNIGGGGSSKQVVKLEGPRPSKMMSQRPEIIIPPRSTAIIPPGQVKHTLLHLFDVGSPSRMTLKEKRDTFRTLQKYLTAEIGSRQPIRPMLDATVRALEAILIKEKDLKEAFFTAMLQHPCFSASLIRLLTSALVRPTLEESAAASIMTNVAEAVLNDNTKKRKSVFPQSPLWLLLETYLVKKGHAHQKNKRKGQAASNEADEANNATADKQEKSIKIKVENALNKKDTKRLIEDMAKMLITAEDSSSNKGLINDWLQKIDPELKGLTPELRQQLLFNNNPHLLTVFSHLSDWKQLKETINDILSSTGGGQEASKLKLNAKDYEAKSVMDFLATCVYLKMQWQCNDKHKPKHDSGPQDVLGLSQEQVERVLDLAIAEAVQDKQSDDSSQKSMSTIKSRIPLILSCLNTLEKANKAMTYLQLKNMDNTSSSSSSKESIVVKLLILQIYMKLPQSLIHPWQVLKNSEIERGNDENDEDTSEVDTTSHFLLSALASTQQGRGWTDQMREFEAAARKLAATHPLLILRNLPLLAAGMKGRTDFDFSFFRSRNHMTFYSMALGLLELTTPHVFDTRYTVALKECLDCYMSMLDNYFPRRDAFSGLVEKVVGFLHLYLTHAPKVASEFIGRHKKTLAQYWKAQANSPALTELANIVRLEDLDEEVVHLSGPPNFTSQEHINTQESAGKLAANLQTAMDNGDDQELLESLNMAKLCSQTHPGVLIYLCQAVSSLISHDSKNVRNLAYDLYIKLLRHDPNLSRTMSESYINCLQSDTPNIAGHALEKLPDVAPLAQEQLHTILSTAFSLGHSNLEVVNPLCDTLTMLNSLSGY